MGVERIPVPCRFTVVGVVLPLLVTVSAPVVAPRAVGVNVTETVQVAPASRLYCDDGQVVDCFAKSPEIAMP